MGEMVIGIRKQLIDKDEGIKSIEKRLIKERVKRGNEKCRIVRVYVSLGT